MCRLFGFRSVINSQVHSSLLNTENALSSQSLKHPDGWGVAYYRENTPHIIRSIDRALDDHLFHKISGVVSSQTVIAHIRKATHGKLNILNSHPFQYGKWIFAHNGNLKDFHKYREDLLTHIDPDLKRFILGTTDSEVVFYLILTELKKRINLAEDNVKLSELKDVTQAACRLICQYAGDLYGKEENDPTKNHLTFLLTSGKVMVALNGGQKLHYSTYKSVCSERNTCEFYDKVCENPVQNDDKINHLVFSSEPLAGENQWVSLENGEFVGVDSNMHYYKFQLDLPFEK